MVQMPGWYDSSLLSCRVLLAPPAPFNRGLWWCKVPLPDDSAFDELDFDLETTELTTVTSPFEILFAVFNTVAV